MRRRHSFRRRMTLIAVAVIAGTALFFTYFGIEAAKNLDVSLYDSTVVSKDHQQTKYHATIQFRNANFVPLPIGDTTYSINIDGEYLGTGIIKSFMIGPYSTTLVNTEFTSNNAVLDRYGGEIPHERTQLTGTSNYNLYFTTFDVPINYNPTAEQIQKFAD